MKILLWCDDTMSRTHKQARAAGANELVARGQVVERMPAMLKPMAA